MEKDTLTQRTSVKDVFAFDDNLGVQIEAFIVDRRSQNLASGTVRFYVQKFKMFTTFCESQAVTLVSQIDATLIRKYILWLADHGHNAGGQHAGYRSLKAFLTWWATETEPDRWKNPFNKIKAPRLPVEPLEPADLADVQAMIAKCPTSTLIGARDAAILLALLDTGCRASEFISINLEDCDIVGGSALVRQGKGRKPRQVYFGQRTRKVIRAYLRLRTDKNPALWIGAGGTRIKYSGLRQIIRRRAAEADVKRPSLHSFRRAFALNSLRNGADVHSLSKMMGHSDIGILSKYLKQLPGDLATIHARVSPVDHLDHADS